MLAVHPLVAGYDITAISKRLSLLLSLLLLLQGESLKLVSARTYVGSFRGGDAPMRAGWRSDATVPRLHRVEQRRQCDGAHTEPTALSGSVSRTTASV